mgnify:CR=1 FL=1
MLNEMTKFKNKRTGLIEYHFGGVNKRYLKRPAVIVMQKWDKKGGWSLFVWNPILGARFKNDQMSHAHMLHSRHNYLQEAKAEAKKILRDYPNHERDCET